MLIRSLSPIILWFSGLIDLTLAENCVLRARDDAGDDTPALLDVFKRCGRDGTISLPDPVYHINRIMNTTNLKNCQIDLKGKLLVSTRN
jgi:galacturan 1,4-alpha-galacturonidase